MAAQLKERKDMDPAYMWDLTTIFKNTEEWEKSLNEVKELARSAAAFAGTLNTAENIRKFMDAQTEVTRKLSNVFEYAFLKRSEDLRNEEAQMMFAKSG